ncbi:MAG: hypothetical protein J6X60_10570, partial [Ruminiclostridium sp.]|nr:hypothetical protein [Ruminiclostridium sp.]
MKLKFSLLLCLLAALTLSLAGCADKNGKAGTSASSSETTPLVTAVSDDNGEYEAGKDGRVTDGTDEAAGTSPDKGIDNDEKRPSDVTDDGMVGTSDSNDGQVISDEAAFAPSYIGRTSGNTKIGWGLGKERDSMNRPIDAVRAQEKYAPLGAEFLAPDGSICLTFDEGYEN